MEGTEIHKSVFLVDDDSDDHFVFGTALREVDAEVHFNTFSSCAELLTAFSQTNHFPQLIVMDMNMPGTDGCQCLRDIRFMEILSSVPVIMYSTASSPAAISTAYEEGARGFFVKPNSMSDLKIIIQHLLRDWVYKTTESTNLHHPESLPAEPEL